MTLRSPAPLVAALALLLAAWLALEGVRSWTSAQVEVGRLRVEEERVRLYRDTVKIPHRRRP
jgi:hypothetical protein